MKLEYRNDEETYCAVEAENADGESVVVVRLDGILEDAEREFALRLHLDDWTRMMVVNGQCVEVNPHQAASEISPDEAVAKVAWVKVCLSKVKRYQPNGLTPELSFPDFHLMTLEQLREVGYNSLKLAVERDCPEEVAKGMHDLVNLLYTLTERKPMFQPEIDYFNTICEAWSGIPQDRRKWYRTTDADYYVMTDDEADRAWDEDLENYIDECLEIPTSMKPYFDRERWKKDARVDGRGHSVGRYDGNEYPIDHDDLSETYFIFRQN